MPRRAGARRLGLFHAAAIIGQARRGGAITGKILRFRAGDRVGARTFTPCACPVSDQHAQGNPGRRRGREPPAHAARRPDPPARRRASTPGCRSACACCARSSRSSARRWTAPARSKSLMPAVQPAELWQESGRWDQLRAGAAALQGSPRARLRARPDARGGRSPTSRAASSSSYRQLPVNFYQIQTKFRDEIRPRFGLMRGREFIMKDAYSLPRRRRRRWPKATGRCTTPTRASSTRCGLHVPRRGGRHRRASAATPRRSSRCSPTPARTRSRSPTAATTRPTSSRPRRRRRAARARPPAQAAARGRDARRAHHRGRSDAS